MIDKKKVSKWPQIGKFTGKNDNKKGEIFSKMLLTLLIQGLEHFSYIR